MPKPAPDYVGGHGLLAGKTVVVTAAAGTGIALTGLTCLLAAPIGDIFHLDGVAATVAMSLMLLPMTLTGAFQGMLLGAERLGRLSALYVLTAATSPDVRASSSAQRRAMMTWKAPAGMTSTMPSVMSAE